MKGPRLTQPNTGNDDQPLVIPDVDSCPLCGAWLVYRWMNKTRWQIPGASEAQAIVPEFPEWEHEAPNDHATPTPHATLGWRCTRCGFAWAHGEWADTDVHKP